MRETIEDGPPALLHPCPNLRAAAISTIAPATTIRQRREYTWRGCRSAQR